MTSNQLGLPPHLLSSICYVESHYKVTAVHHDDGDGDSLGVCQIKLKTARWLGYKGTKKNLMNPTINAYFAGKYLKHQIKRYKGDIKKAVISYNLGHAKGLTSTEYQRKVYKKWRRLCSGIHMKNI